MVTTNSTIWAPKGEQGDPGPQGPIGPIGPQGPEGGPGPDAGTFVAFVNDLANQTDPLKGAHKIGFNNTTVDVVLYKVNSFPNVAAAIAATIPATADKIQTGCAVTPGYGGAVFSRYAGSSTPDGFCIIQTADGSKWKADGIPTTWLFGAVFGADNTVALQRFMTYASLNNETMDWNHWGKISASVTATVPVDAGHQPTRTNYCRKFIGKMQLSRATNKIIDGIKFTGFVQTTWEDFEYVGDVVLANRFMWNPIVLEGCKYARWGTFHIIGCLRTGLHLRSYCTEFYGGELITLYCGVGDTHKILMAPYVSHFRFGVTTGQRSAFDDMAVPEILQAGDGLIINGSYYQVMNLVNSSLDRNQVQVFPAVSATDLTNIAGAYWCIGGGFRHSGGENNAGSIGRFSGLVNGHDVQLDDLYPATIYKFVSQVSTVAIRVGVDITQAYRGGSALDSYIEGTKFGVVELAQSGDPTTGASPFFMGQTGQFTPVKGYVHPNYINDDLTKNEQRNMPQVRTSAAFETVAPYGIQSPVASTRRGNTPVITIAASEVGGGASMTVQLKLDKYEYEAHGTYSILIAIYGVVTGVPGTITFTAESGITVMSAASKSTALSACTIIAAFRNNNWTLIKSPAYTYVT